jgi:exosome complex component RRP45
VLDNGGNAVDAASLAALAALMHFRRADVTVVGEHVTVHSYMDRAPVPLSIHHTPVSVTFGVCGTAGDVMFADPTDREELVMDGRITFSVNAHKELCGVHKIGEACSSVGGWVGWVGGVG